MCVEGERERERGNLEGQADVPTELSLEAKAALIVSHDGFVVAVHRDSKAEGMIQHIGHRLGQLILQSRYGVAHGTLALLHQAQLLPDFVGLSQRARSRLSRLVTRLGGGARLCLCTRMGEGGAVHTMGEPSDTVG